MSEPTKAVFLSYASQDAEAAKRICEALRAAGVEVWFDQSELVGGDQWDAKIRGQISSCALFMPIISASTQARREGYFRIEWKLAAQRTHAMSDDTAFLLPIVIDDTKDTVAKVPAEFKTVQWTRLPAGETPPAFCARVKKLLAEEGRQMEELLRPDASSPSRRDAPPATRPSSRWLVPAIAGVLTVAVLAIWQPWRSENPELAKRPNSKAPLSEARQLVAKAWQTLDNLPEPSRSELDTAAEYYQRAVALDPTDADVWALGSQIDTWYVALNIDDSPGRREAARTKATKALNLSPASYEARLAQAVYLVRGEGFDTPSSFAAEAEQQLRALLREQPDEPHALLALGHLLRNSRKIEEASPLFDRLAMNPAWTATATNAKAWMLYRNARFDEAVPVVARSVEARPFLGNVRLQGYLAMEWQGDLELAKTAVERMPAAERREDDGAYFAVTVHWYRREPEQMLRVLNTRPTDWVQSHSFTGPKGYWVGIAQQMAGNQEAATLAWQGGLRLVEQQLAGNASSMELQVLKGQLLVRLGERAAAEKAFNLAGHLGWQGRTAFELGDAEAVLAQTDRGDGMSWMSWATLRFNPQADFLRGNPQFEAYVAAAAKDPKRSPRAKRVVSSESSALVKADAKSVAVLAFANLSDDKANEYFSDGISEELLNVLAKVPGLKVSARTSAFYFKGKEVPIPEIAKQLGVAYVVEGSVRKQGDKVRITAQLIKAGDGFHVWSDTFTRDLKDIFAVQDEIAGLIAQNLELKMGIGEAGARQAVSPEAYQEYLLGRAAAAKASMADMREAVGHFERAVSLEPKYTAAWVQLTSVHTRLGRWGGAPTLASWAAARQAIDRALALEPDSPEVLLALGWILRTGEWNWRESERAFRRALALQPNNPEILAGTAVLLFNIGQIDEAFRLARQAVQLDPLNPGTQVDLSIMFFESRNWVESERAARRALQLAPDGTSYHSVLAWPLINQQRYAEAEAEIALDTDLVQQSGTRGLLAIARGDQAKVRAMLALLEELAKTQPDRADLQTCTAWLHAGLGDKDRAFAALEKARASRDPSMAWLRDNTELTSLFSDPRWDALLHQIGLADAQLK